MARLFYALIGLAFTVACAADRGRPSQGAGAAPQTDSTIVFNDNASLAGAPTLRGTVDLDIGSPSVQWAHISDITIDPTGNIYALDPRSKSVFRFRPNGEMALRYGRTGDGPGEFQAPLRLAAWQDTLVVFDMRRLHVFDISGKLIRTVPYNSSQAAATDRPQGGGFLLVEQARHTADGTYVIIDLINGGEKGIGPYTDTLVLQKIDITTGARGERVTSVLTPPVYLLGSGNMFMRKPLGNSEERIVIGADGRMYLSAGDSYTITVLGRDGTRERSYVGEIVTGKISENDLLAAIDRELNEFLRSHTPPPPRDTAVISVLRTEAIKAGHAEQRPAIGRVFASSSGELLVERLDLDKELRNPWVMPSVPRDSDFPDPVATRDSIKWDLLDSSGKIAGRLTLPPNIEILHFSGQHLYGVSRDDNRIPRLVRLRIEK